ncbi:MAG: TIGR03960 family B12-binding radical SAM protein [Candidatus Humimicrobiaceae bacterium]
MTKMLGRTDFEKVIEGVQKPGRYIGQEFGSKSKKISGNFETDPKALFALAFPDVYEVGMSNLGIQVLYETINHRIDFSAERVFAPWVDLEANLKADKIKLFSLENRVFLDEFDIIGFSLQHEMQYTNVLNMLEMGGLKLRAKERTDYRKPIVCAGGPSVINPLPMAPFMDFFVIGDGEEVILKILDVILKYKSENRKKEWFLSEIKKFEGIFVPSDYKFSYSKNGTIKKITPDLKVKKASVKDLDDFAIVTNPVIANIKPVHDRFVCEIMRGCFRGCRFCQAGFTYRPVRSRKAESLISDCMNGLKKTGYDEISFLSLSSADYRELEFLIKSFLDLNKNKKISISLPSLRLDSFTINIAEMIQSGRKTGLTFAPEAGSQAMRDIIGKNIDEEEMLECIRVAFEKGWEKVKLYFMIGFPFEKMEDIEGITDIVQKIIAAAKNVLPKNKLGRMNINLSINAFCPKPFTPFQWAPQDSIKMLEDKFALIRNSLPKRFVTVSWSDPKKSRIECVLARGNIKVAEAVEEAFKNGAKFDNWSEFFKYEIWQDAFDKTGIDINHFTERKAGIDEILPWDFIDISVSKEVLVKEIKKAEKTASENYGRH